MSQVFSFGDSSLFAISFCSNQQIILTIHPDGRLERGPGFETDDEASVAFFDCLARYCPGFIAELHQRAEAAEEHARTVIEVARNSCRQYERERDSLRPSLARVVEAASEVLNYIGLAEFLDSVHVHGNRVWGIRKDDLLTLRSALHRSQG